MGRMNDQVLPVRDGNSAVIGEEQLKLLERLCNASAVSGDEGEVRAIVLEEIRPHVTEFKIDALGNILATKNVASIKDGATPQADHGERRLRVMIAAHMDEVGFMLTNDEGDGIFRFDTVGGLDARQLVGKSVWVGKSHVPAVIGAKPIHLTEDDELRRTITLETLRIDLGPGNKGKAKVGDRAVFSTPFTRLGPSLRAKALDDRFGVATLIELVKIAPPNIDLLAAFTVQEEVGLRGARVAAYAFDPDLAFVLDCTPANDLPPHDAGEPGSANTHYNTRLGSGPAIYIADSSTLADPRLVRHLVETAETLGIPYQIRQPGGGGTDAGAIHKQRVGIPTISISVPGRYLHTAASIARLEDWQNSLALVYAALERLDPAILSAER
jgi:tetrahedral aminopeptidase